MFSENLKNMRKAKSLSQEELAERLHVVRQTISKWEKGLSVPDADTLIGISDIFQTSVSDLLGSTMETPEKENEIAQKLEQLNVLIAEKNRRSRRIWKAVAGILIFIAVATVVCIVMSVVSFQSYDTTTELISQPATERVVQP